MADNLTSYKSVRRFMRVVKVLLGLVLLAIKILKSIKDF